MTYAANVRFSLPESVSYRDIFIAEIV